MTDLNTTTAEFTQPRFEEALADARDSFRADGGEVKARLEATYTEFSNDELWEVVQAAQEEVEEWENEAFDLIRDMASPESDSLSAMETLRTRAMTVMEGRPERAVDQGPTVTVVVQLMPDVVASEWADSLQEDTTVHAVEWHHGRMIGPDD